MRRVWLAGAVCAVVVAVSTGVQAQGAAAGHPWSDASLGPDARADLVVKELTGDEKIQLVHGIGWGVLREGDPVPADNNGGAGQVLGIARLGIPSIQQADSAVGARMAALNGRYATLLPSVLGAASSWDPEAAYLYGDVIGRELRAQGYTQSIGGGTNLARDPRNGRLFEYPGEDPVLAGTTVGNLIRGLQSNHIMGDIKHYAFNDQETGRTVVDVHLDRKAAHESDLLAFEIGIKIGHPASVMCSYNKFEGDWTCQTPWLLTHVLKEQWKFPGFVVSDWEATHSTVKAANAGMDMQMPGEEYFGAPLKQAVAAGEVKQARLDDMCHRILRSLFATGAFDHPSLPRTVVDPFKGRDDAQHIAEESIVLLKNDKGVLPLAAGVRSIAVIGAHADKGIMSGGGSAQVDAPGGDPVHPGEGTQWGHEVYFASAPLKYIREHAPGAKVEFNEGTDAAEAAALAKSADVAIVFADQYMSEGADAKTLALPHGQDAVIAAVTKANPRTVVVLVTGNPVTMPWVADAAAVMEAWYPGIAGGEAIANLLFGTVNPSGKLPITFARTEADLPHAEIFDVPGANEAGHDEHWREQVRRESFPADYTEGARFGYKWFDSEHKEPLFAFGYGLSYTTYRYADLKVDAGAKTATLTVKNTGKRAGTEIVELYAQLPKESGESFRRLVAWQRVALGAGEQKTVTLTIDPTYVSVWDAGADAWKLLPGTYAVSAGSSSRELPLKATMVLP